MAVDKADRFWPGVARLVVAILIVLFIVFGLLIYLASMTEMG